MLFTKIARQWSGLLAAGVLCSSLECYAQSPQPWEASVRVSAQSSSTAYTYENRFGTALGATRNFDIGIDLRSPPPQPSGIHAYQQTDDNVAVLRHYINTNNINASFRGIIQYNGFTPLSAFVQCTDLPGSNWTLLAFSDTIRSNLTASYSITNGQDISISTATRSYIVTQKPRFTSIAAQRNIFGNTDISLEALFHCYDAVNLEIQRSTALPWSFNPLGVMILMNSEGSYATNNLTEDKSFFRTKPIKK